MEKYFYNALITKVYDGDTVTAEIDLGFNVKIVEKIRLFGINAPELRGAEKTKGILSKDELTKLVINKYVLLQTVKDKKEKYGRFLGIIHLGGININQLLVEGGFAENKEY
jgi:micrococcal nuclease